MTNSVSATFEPDLLGKKVRYNGTVFRLIGVGFSSDVSGGGYSTGTFYVMLAKATSGEIRTVEVKVGELEIADMRDFK